MKKECRRLAEGGEERERGKEGSRKENGKKQFRSSCHSQFSFRSLASQLHPRRKQFSYFLPEVKDFWYYAASIYSQRILCPKTCQKQSPAQFSFFFPEVIDFCYVAASIYLERFLCKETWQKQSSGEETTRRKEEEGDDFKERLRLLWSQTTFITKIRTST